MAAVLRRRWQLGELVRVVDDLYLPADLEAWPVARCHAVRQVLRPGWSAGLASSVWARGGPGRSPADHVPHDAHDLDVLAPPAAALRVPDGVRVRLVRVPAGAVEQVHGVAVTTLTRTAAEGHLTSTRHGRRVLWDLTPSGAALLEEGTRRIYGFMREVHPWDGRWLVLSVPIPETQRQLRHRLRHHHARPFGRACGEARREDAQCRLQAMHHRLGGSEVHHRGEAVIGGLATVHVIVGVHRAAAAQGRTE